MHSLTRPFTHLNTQPNGVLTDEFCKKFTTIVKEVIVERLSNMTERDLKDIDKDEIYMLIYNSREFLQISLDNQESNEFIETTIMAMSLRFLKSENLEKRLKGLGEIRNMCDRVIERNRFERWRGKTGGKLSQWNAMPDNKDKPYPS